MTVVGIIYLTSVPVLPSAQTPAVAILSHLSDLFPTQSHRPFFLDHRLFVSTSSLLPGTDNKRTFTHLFTSSHLPQKTYIGTSCSSAIDSTDGKKNNTTENLSTITVPTSTSLEPLTSLIVQKLQPQWAARQFLISDNGASTSLPITDDANWKISIADLRLAPAKVSGAAAGQLRGILIEIQYESNDIKDKTSLEDELGKKNYEALFRQLLKSLFKNLKFELNLVDAKLYITQTKVEDFSKDGSNRSSQGEKSQRRSGKPSGYEIAELYMEALRGSRG